MRSAEELWADVKAHAPALGSPDGHDMLAATIGTTSTALVDLSHQAVKAQVTPLPPDLRREDFCAFYVALGVELGLVLANAAATP